MSAEATYIAAQRAVFEVEKRADTIKLKRAALDIQITELNNELVNLSEELAHRQDAAAAALEAWRMVETARAPEAVG